MYRQEVKGKPLSGFKGILVVFGVLAAAMLGSAFFTLLEKRIGNAASIGFIVYCCLLAWFLLTYYIMGFVYAIGGGCLRICRTYGKRERFMCDVWLNTVQAYGNPEDVQKKFPGARLEKALKPRCEIPVFALAYKSDDKTVILHIQPDDKMKEQLIAGLRKKQRSE